MHVVVLLGRHAVVPLLSVVVVLVVLLMHVIVVLDVCLLVQRQGLWIITSEVT